jgi:4-azaleucine resistance transporter AzlC
LNARWLAFLSGGRDELPILVGVVPFGMIYGVLALAAGIPFPAAQAMSAIVFAGSSQFIATQLVSAGAPAWVFILTVAVVNLRHALYSASIAPYLQPLRRPWKFLLAYLLTDEAYAIAIAHYQRRLPSAHAHFYFLGAGLALWASWQLSTAVGIFLGQVIPASWGLDFTLSLTFIALVVPGIKDRPSLLAALSAGFIALLAHGLPYKLGLVLAAVVGIAVGVLADTRSPQVAP